MPRGKILKETPSLQSSENKTVTDDINDNSVTKFTLVEPQSEEGDAEAHAESSPMRLLEKDNPNTLNFKFTLLLVALFVAVNIGLVALLDESKPNNTPQLTKDENAVVKLPENKADAQEKPELPGASAATSSTGATGADDTKPVLDNSAAEKSSADKTSSENIPAEKPANAVQPSEQPANPPLVKQNAEQSGSDQDLLSIISKD